MVTKRCVVEFSRSDGTTIAWFAVEQNEVKPYEEQSLSTLSQQAPNPSLSA
ncbi:MAG: hypothetical protein KME29_33490 [Calothrix sp. FI2-JRJ7]|nr:hypothetical protein [Calothrix sp. FI2-JRJ7]